MADADVDGQHITTLCADAVLFRFMRAAGRARHVFCAAAVTRSNGTAKGDTCQYAYSEGARRPDRTADRGSATRERCPDSSANTGLGGDELHGTVGDDHERRLVRLQVPLDRRGHADELFR